MSVTLNPGPVAETPISQVGNGETLATFPKLDEATLKNLHQRLDTLISAAHELETRHVAFEQQAQQLDAGIGRLARDIDVLEQRSESCWWKTARFAGEYLHQFYNFVYNCFARIWRALTQQ